MSSWNHIVEAQDEAEDRMAIARKKEERERDQERQADLDREENQ